MKFLSAIFKPHFSGDRSRRRHHGHVLPDVRGRHVTGALEELVQVQLCVQVSNRALVRFRKSLDREKKKNAQNGKSS
jgi:hypothetical protein